MSSWIHSSSATTRVWIRTKDAALHFNFRPDRARELTRALAIADFDSFARKNGAPFSAYACMTLYDGTFGLPIAFPKESYPGHLSGGDWRARS